MSPASNISSNSRARRPTRSSSAIPYSFWGPDWQKSPTMCVGGTTHRTRVQEVAEVASSWLYRVDIVHAPISSGRPGCSVAGDPRMHVQVSPCPTHISTARHSLVNGLTLVWPQSFTSGPRPPAGDGLPHHPGRTRTSPVKPPMASGPRPRPAPKPTTPTPLPPARAGTDHAAQGAVATTAQDASKGTGTP